MPIRGFFTGHASGASATDLASTPSFFRMAAASVA
jgi:hypothetical protein